VKYLFVVLVSLIFILQAQSQQVLSVQGASQNADLVCPSYKKPVPLQKNTSDQSDIEYALPEGEILESIKKQVEPQPNQIQVQIPKRSHGEPFRMAIWGDSHSAAAFLTEELIKSMGLDAESALPSFIPPSMGRPGVRLPIRKYCQSANWEFNYAYTGVNPESFGPALLKLNASANDSYLWVDFRSKKSLINNLKKLDILFSKTNGIGAKIGIQVDNRPEEIFEINSNQATKLTIQGDSSFGVLKIRLIEGAISLNGFLPSYTSNPKVYIDTMGIPSATVMGWQYTNKNYIDELNISPNYDLVILEYGTNEGSRIPFDSKKYSDMLRRSLASFRSVYPSASCVLMGPTDRGIWHKKTYIKKGKKRVLKAEPMPNFLMYSNIHQEITQIQNQVGKEFSCSSWSWQNAMGGPGSAYNWIKQNPPLMARDLIHLTVQGYQQTGRDLSESLNLLELVNMK
jgi:hypothetical protein